MDGPAALPSLGPTLGAVVLGALFSSVLYGISLLQTFNYFHAEFAQDRKFTEVLVIIVCILETVHTGFLWAYVYSSTVEDFGDLTMAAEMHWGLSYSVPVANIVVCIVQIFYVYRIYILSGNRWYPSASILATIMRLVGGIYIPISAASMPVQTYVAKFEWLVISTISLSAVVDTANTIALCICLRKNFTVQESTQRLIEKITLWTIETGLITSLFGIVEIILFICKKGSFVWFLFWFQTAKLYSNGFLASLNGRKRLRTIQTQHEFSDLVFRGSQSRSLSANHQLQVQMQIDHISSRESIPASDFPGSAVLQNNIETQKELRSLNI